jgi:hypothetical protein
MTKTCQALTAALEVDRPLELLEVHRNAKLKGAEIRFSWSDDLTTMTFPDGSSIEASAGGVFIVKEGKTNATTENE